MPAAPARHPALHRPRQSMPPKFLTAVPAALLFPVLFVRIDRRIALPVYLILLAASVYIAVLQ